MGITIISPGASRENATRPGPRATLRTNGIPERSRLAPPGVFITAMGTVSSFHSMVWCSKKTESAGLSVISTTGTTPASSWQVLEAQWNSVRSRRRGAWRHPESVTTSCTSRGAPQRSQVRAELALWAWHHRHWMRCSTSVIAASPLPVGDGTSWKATTEHLRIPQNLRLQRPRA